MNISDKPIDYETSDLDVIFPPPSPVPSIEPDLTVNFILSPKFTLLPFAGFIDCLRHAADELDHSRQIYCQWQVIAPTIEPIHASCGLHVMPQLTLKDASVVDYLVICGGRLPWSLEIPQETLTFIQEAYKNGTKIIGLCTGSFIVARAGLLENKFCALHVIHRKQFENLFPGSHPVTDRSFINEDGIITCNGGTSTIDLAYTLIEAHSGKARAVKALKGLVGDHHRAEHYKPQRLFGHLASCGNWRVEQATALMEQNFSKPLSVSSIALRLHTSERELNRAFIKHANHSPSVICRTMRLTHGRWLLTNTNRTITQIAFECGFSDGPHFSRWFKVTYGEPPNLFRQRRRKI